MKCYKCGTEEDLKIHSKKQRKDGSWYIRWICRPEHREWYRKYRETLVSLPEPQPNKEWVIKANEINGRIIKKYAATNIAIR